MDKYYIIGAGRRRVLSKCKMLYSIISKIWNRNCNSYVCDILMIGECKRIFCKKLLLLWYLIAKKNVSLQKKQLIFYQKNMNNYGFGSL